MTIDYALAKKQYPKQKAALTRAVNSGDPNKVVAACIKAVDEWSKWGAWPDGWHRWNIALQDAQYDARRKGIALTRSGEAFSLEDL